MIEWILKIDLMPTKIAIIAKNQASVLRGFRRFAGVKVLQFLVGSIVSFEVDVCFVMATWFVFGDDKTTKQSKRKNKILLQQQTAPNVYNTPLFPGLLIKFRERVRTLTGAASTIFLLAFRSVRSDAPTANRPFLCRSRRVPLPRSGNLVNKIPSPDADPYGQYHRSILASGSFPQINFGTRGRPPRSLPRKRQPNTANFQKGPK